MHPLLFTIALLSLPVLASTLTVERQRNVPPTPYHGHDALSGFSWKNCTGSGKLRMKVVTISVTPLPVVTDGATSVTVDVSLVVVGNDPIKNGTLDFALSFGGVPVESKTISVCGKDKPFDIKCPVSAGTLNIKKTFVFDKLAYTGSLSGVSRVMDQGGNEIACIDFSLPVVPKHKALESESSQ
eukprot:Rhum_TRINITY_DN18834_c0_g1::Rhum_TRINITY_DN18834_c0_g1_i1::g.168568::m.168568